MKNDLSQYCINHGIVQICWHIDCSTLAAASFRIWNISAGIPSPPVTLPLHSRMAGTRWVITPSWLSGSLRSLFYRSVYSCHLFLISSASLRSIQFLSFIVPIFALNVPLVSLIFLKWSLVFILLLSSISLHWSFMKAFLFLLWNSAFRWVYLSFSLLPFSFLLYSAICKSSSDNHCAFILWGWFWTLSSVQCYKPPFTVIQALHLSDLIPWIYLSIPLYNNKGFDLSHIWMG